jgi:hypothetical protein
MARGAVTTARAARPAVVVPRFGREVRRVELARTYLRDRAGVLRPKLGASDPEAEAQERGGRAGRIGLRDEIVRRAGGPPAEPIVVDAAPNSERTLGVLSEQGTAYFALLDAADDAPAYVAMGYSATAVPCWIVVALFAAWPLTSGVIAGLRARTRRVRTRRGLCPSCGYDLRATGQAGGQLLDRCPECGRINPTSDDAAASRMPGAAR